jgi:hypothetical protein
LIRTAELLDDAVGIGGPDGLVSSLDGKSLLAVPDMATEPLFLAIREAPKTRMVSALERTLVLVDIRNGEFSVGAECKFDAQRH